MTFRRSTALLVFLTASSAFAQVPQVQPGAADVLRSTQTPPAPPTRGESAIPKGRIEARPALNLAGDIKVNVSAFKFSGNTALDGATLAAAVAGSVNRELDAAGLVEAVRKVRREYTSRGYFLAVAYLPQQEIKDGVVEIAVLEGRLGEIKVSVAPGTRYSETQARELLEAHLKPGDLITESSLERPLLLMRDLPGLTARSFLDPGKEMGTADLKVEVTSEATGKLISGSVDADNYGVRFAGEHRVGAQVNLNSPLGYGDRLSLRAQVAEQTDTNLGTLSYLIPVGPYGTRVGASYTDLRYKLYKNTALETLKAHGEAFISGVDLVHPIIRRRDSNLILRLRYEEKDARDFTTTGGEDQKKLSNAAVELSGDYFDSYKGYTTASLGWVSGRLKLLNPTTQAGDLAGARSQGTFGKTNWNLSRFQQLPADFYLYLAASGQIASKNLSSIERFALGGPNGVRAFPQGDASGDNGELYSVEVRHAVPALQLLQRPLTASLFYDWGRVDVYAKPELLPAAQASNQLSRAGYGFGLSAGSRESALLKLSVAWPISNNPGRDSADPVQRVPRAYFQLLRDF